MEYKWSQKSEWSKFKEIEWSNGTNIKESRNKKVKKIIDFIFDGLELEQDLWLELENIPEYKSNMYRIEEIEKKCKKNLYTNLEEQKEDVQELRNCCYSLLFIAQRYFFSKGFTLGGNTILHLFEK